ncbi:MAG: hypothetical protein AB1742_05540 [bacterium]
MKRFGRTVMILALFSGAAGSPCLADGFALRVENPVVRVGGSFNVDMVLAPVAGEQVIGGQVFVRFDPAAVEVSAHRDRYSSDAAFSTVEMFSVDAASGTIIFRARAPEPPTGRKIFLRVRARLIAPGATVFHFSSSVVTADERRLPSLSGYYQLFGIGEEGIDPLLYSALMSENNLLSAGVEVKKRAVEAETALGGVELKDVREREMADAIMGFSKKSITIGQGQWVRLDVLIKKFPRYELLSGASLTVSYDARYLTPTDSGGNATNNRVELVEPFTFEFQNQVDRTKGEIRLVVMTPMDVKLENPQFPVRLVSLYFKARGVTPAAAVRLSEVLLPVSAVDATLLREDAVVSVASGKLSCDPDLPPTLCPGNFELNGSVSFRISNSQQTAGAAAAPGAAAQQTTGYTATIEKMYLEQTWDLKMSGSFPNGIGLKGELVDSPHQDQQIRMRLIGTRGELLFGDFSASLAGASLVGLPVKAATGLQLAYKYGPWNLNALGVELRSSPGQRIINGNGTKGPYSITGEGSPVIIPASVCVEKDGACMAPGDYEFDTSRGELRFTKEPLLKNQSVTFRYEQSALNFSMGNITGGRLEYVPENRSFKAGATFYTTTSAQEGVSMILSAAQTFNLFKLPDVEDASICAPRTCKEVQLDHPFIIEGSILITAPNATPVREKDYLGTRILLGHRGRFQGKVYLRTSDFQHHYESFTITYDYYNPSYVNPIGYRTYTVTNEKDTSRQPWPTQIVPGSETLFVSDDEDPYVNNDDYMLCFNDPSSRVPADDPDVCPGDFGVGVLTGYSYKLVPAGGSFYVEFTEPMIPQNVFTDPGKPVHVKMKYHTIPAFLPSSSEFEKQALGFDAQYKAGRKWTFDAEFGRTNSDLSSSLHTIEDRIEVDASTSYLQPSSGNVCSYEYVTGTYGTLKCRLSRDRVFGQVLVEIQRCRRDTVTGTCLDEFDVPETFTSVYHIDEGYVIMSGRNTAGAEYSTFPDRGDILIVDYVYELTVSRLVEGTARDFSAKYDSKKLNFTLRRFKKHPFYDKNMMARALAETSLTEGTLNLAIKNFRLDLSRRDPQVDTVDAAGVLKSSMKNPSDALTLNYNSGRLSSLTFSLKRGASRGVTDVATNQQTDTRTRENGFNVIYSIIKNGVLDATLTRNSTRLQNLLYPSASTMADTEAFGFTYRPRENFTAGYGNSTTRTSPGSRRSTELKYNLTFPVLRIAKAGVNKTRSKSSAVLATGAIGAVNDTIDYNLDISPFWRVSNMRYTFTRNDSPARGDATAGTRNDNQNLNFAFKLTRKINLNPTYQRTSYFSANSHTSQKTFGWTSAYGRTEGKITLSLSLNQTTTKGTTTTTTGGMTTATPTGTRKTGIIPKMTYVASKETTYNLSLDYSKSPGSVSRNWVASFTHTPGDRLTLSGSYTHRGAYGAAGSIYKTYDLRLGYRISDDTALDVQYYRGRVSNVSATSASSQRSVRFSAELKTSFKGAGAR